MKEHLAGKCFANDEDLKDAVVTWLNSQVIMWYDEGIHKLVPSMTSALMSKATTMWNSRQMYVPKLVYSLSALLLKNILVWRNVLYFLDGPRI